jgi:hypothetical protein
MLNQDEGHCSNEADKLGPAGNNVVQSNNSGRSLIPWMSNLTQMALSYFETFLQMIDVYFRTILAHASVSAEDGFR